MGAVDQALLGSLIGVEGLRLFLLLKVRVEGSWDY